MEVRTITGMRSHDPEVVHALQDRVRELELERQFLHQQLNQQRVKITALELTITKLTTFARQQNRTLRSIKDITADLSQFASLSAAMAAVQANAARAWELFDQYKRSTGGGHDL